MDRTAFPRVLRPRRLCPLLMGLFAAFAAPAVALTPPGPCQYVPELGRFLTGNEEEGKYPSAQPVLPETFQNGFVFFEIRDVKNRKDGSLWFVLEYCPRSTALMVEAGPEEAAVRARITDMVFGETPYSMRQIADGLQRLGATAHRNAASLGACPCGHQNFYYGDWERPGE